MSTLDIAVAALGTNSALTTGALVYTVRRVSPWPRIPAPPKTGAGDGSKTAGPAGAK